MKNILFYSPDLSLCASVLMYFDKKYGVTTTTNFNNIEKIVKSSKFDLIFLDADPDVRVEHLINLVKKNKLNTPIIISYVYSKKTAQGESSLRDSVSAIFYKPFEMNEISEKIELLLK